METKKCSRCKEEKDTSLFHKKRGTKDGLCCYCKTCKSKIDKKYAVENQDKIRIKSQNYYKTNLEECRRKISEYATQNWEIIKRHKLKWRKKNSVYAKVKGAEWKNINKERIKETDKIWRATNLERLKNRNKERRQNLSDGYVRSILCHRSKFKAQYYSDESVEVEKAILQFDRLIKNKNKIENQI